MVIALDDVGSVERSSFRDLCRFLFARIAGGLDMSPVRMVVGLTRDEFEDRWPPQLKQICQRVRVGNIPANEFFPLAREFFVHNGEDPKRHEEWIRTNQEFVKSAFPPSTLKTLLHLARQINGT